MIFGSGFLLRIFVIILAFCGFWVAGYISVHKKKGTKPLVCPINFDCHSVVHSDYSKLFRIPVELLGMIYYGFVFLAYCFMVLRPQFFPAGFSLFVSILSALAFVFSIYLIAVQVFILKKGCLWCFISALLTVGIFILTMFIHGAVALNSY